MREPCQGRRQLYAALPCGSATVRLSLLHAPCSRRHKATCDCSHYTMSDTLRHSLCYKANISHLIAHVVKTLSFTCVNPRFLSNLGISIKNSELFVMPSEFIRSIFPKRLRHRDGEEAVTSQAVSQTSEKATNCPLQDPPPPYASDNHAPDDEKEPPLDMSLPRPTIASVSTQPDPNLSSNGSIQFCPHAISSFERIQRIVKLPNFKQSYEGLDALTPGPDHRNPFTAGFRLCKPVSGSALCISEFPVPFPPESHSALSCKIITRVKLCQGSK